IGLVGNSGSSSIKGFARFNWDARTFKFSFAGSNLTAPSGIALHSVSAVGSGNPNKIEVDVENLKAYGARMKACGSYIYKKKNPLNIDIKLMPVLHNNSGDKSAVNADKLNGHLLINGKFSPLNLNATGEFAAKNL